MMSRCGPVLFCCAFALWRASATAQAPRLTAYEIDVAHSEVSFAVKFMGLKTVRGAFSDFSGTILLDDADPARSFVSTVIDVKSINTNSAMRDKDLRSPNFFDAETYPRIVFHSTRVARSADGFTAHGTFSMRGVTKEIDIPFTQMHAPVKDAWGNTRVGFLGHLVLDRRDYGIIGKAFWNKEYDPGKMSIGNDVDITLDIDGIVWNANIMTAPRADTLLSSIAANGLQPALAAYRTRVAADSALRAISDPMLNAVWQKLVTRGQHDIALAVAQVRADLNPQSDDALARLGESYLRSGRSDLALQSFGRALAIDSLNTLAWEWSRALRAK